MYIPILPSHSHTHTYIDNVYNFIIQYTCVYTHNIIFYFILNDKWYHGNCFLKSDEYDMNT